MLFVSNLKQVLNIHYQKVYNYKMNKLLLVLLLSFPLWSQTLVKQEQLQSQTHLSNEGDWCPVSIFTRTSDTIITFTKDAPTTRSCFLHFSLTSTILWTKSDTIMILDNSTPLNDLVFFYWLGPDLHISSRTPFFSCTICKIDAPRVLDVFPANALIAGMYNVINGRWDLSGHPIFNQHQIIGSPMAITYIPNQGYTFTFDITNPKVVAATEAINNLAPTVNKSLTMIQNATTTGINEVQTHVKKAGAMPSDVNIQKAQTQLLEIQTKIADLNNQIKIINQQSIYRRDQYDSQQMNLIQSYMINLGMKRKVEIPKTSTSTCILGDWSISNTFLYLCTENWRRIPLDNSTW